MEIQIGNYNRPGIFINEFDASVIETPTVRGLNTMVIGFSKKGPVNRPVLLNSQSDLEAIFGPLDRVLEKKGSFFHRTVSKMLESSPVLAFNILKTDDTLDRLEYKSFSTTPSFKNDIVRTGPYRRFFDTSGFWKRDTDSFLNITRDNLGDENRIFHLTNMSDKDVTIFVFKSTRQGFDQTLIEWYGSIEKVPSFVYPTDYASDYMVDVVIVAGNWTNYQQLSVDSRWGQYFNTSGLRKEQVSNFVNDNNVTLLSFYNGLSLIPYFRDQNNRNIFIENVINRDTDRTGVFCAFDADRLETDLPNGLIDLVGNSLIKGELSDIEYLSYQDNIVENIPFLDKRLDTVGNVISFGSIYKTGTSHGRTAMNAEGYVHNVTQEPFTFTSGDDVLTIEYTVGTDAYAIINGVKVDITSGTYSFTIDADNYVPSTSYMSVFILNTSGEILKIDNLANDSNVSVGANDIVLGYINFDVDFNSPGNEFSTATLSQVTIDELGYIELSEGTDMDITWDGNGVVTYTFLNTANANITEYERYRRIKFFNYIINFLDSPTKEEMTLLIDNNVKKSMANMVVSNIINTNLQDKAFTLDTKLSESDMLDLGTTSPFTFNLCIFIKDDEFIIGTEGMITKETITTPTEGIVGRYSKFYADYFNGQINSGDYFHENIINDTYTVTFTDISGDDFITFDGSPNDPSFTANTKIVIPQSVSNPGVFTILQAEPSMSGPNSFVYRVSENTNTETINDVNIIFDFNDKKYLKMYIIGSVLTVKFADSDLNPVETTSLPENSNIYVFSKKTNFKQSLEIEQIIEPNRILVNATRYTEVKVGDFLEAEIDESELEFGEVPKRITRILRKRLWAQDTSLVEITTDSAIHIYNFSGDLQTLRITNLNDYVTFFKGIKLKGFKVRQDSMPNGTEARQTEILSNIEKGSPLFKALTSKEAVQFRYLIDGFGLGLIERSKQELMDISGERLDCISFLNMPSMKMFKNSSSPTFTNEEGVLQTSFIRQGGDPESSPAFLYSFGEGRGTTTSAYFLPYLTVNDNGRPLDVPPAMFAATTYMRKLTANQTNILPWTIAAGINNGRITNIADVEMDFTNEDIENLNLMKANPIVRKRNRGFVIETENTSQNLVTSSLSFIHSREVLIELENELADMLLQFQWKFNTQEVRAEIKLRADIICERFQNRGALFAFFNKIDEENNTAEIIDNQMGVLDVYVEITKGMGTIVNNVTILRTNAISLGGFI